MRHQNRPDQIDQQSLGDYRGAISSNPVYEGFPWAEAGRTLGAAGGNEFEATLFLRGEEKTADPKAGSALPCRGKIKLEVGVGRIRRRDKKLEFTLSV